MQLSWSTLLPTSNEHCFLYVCSHTEKPSDGSTDTARASCPTDKWKVVLLHTASNTLGTYSTRGMIQIADMIPPEMGSAVYCALLDELLRWPQQNKKSLSVTVPTDINPLSACRVILHLTEKEKGITLQLAVLDLYSEKGEPYIGHFFTEIGDALLKLNILKERAVILEEEQRQLRKHVEVITVSKTYEKDLSTLLSFQEILNQKKRKYLELEAEWVKQEQCASSSEKERNRQQRGGASDQEEEDSDFTEEKDKEEIQPSKKRRMERTREETQPSLEKHNSVDIIDELFNCK